MLKRVGEGQSERASSVLDQAANVHGEDPQFAQEEFWGVVDTQCIRDLDAYRTGPRPGRGTPLGSKRRAALRRVFDAALEHMQAHGQCTWNGLMSEAVERLDSEVQGTSTSSSTRLRTLRPPSATLTRLAATSYATDNYSLHTA